MSRRGRAPAFGGGLIVLVTVASCTAGPARRSEPTPAASSSPAVAVSAPSSPGTPELCRSLVGRPFHTAMSGGGVTCSFGPGSSSTDIRVITRRCPDTAPFYEFYSTDPSDRVDRSRYFGSQVSQLFRTAGSSMTVSGMAAESCR